MPTHLFRTLLCGTFLLLSVQSAFSQQDTLILMKGNHIPGRLVSNDFVELTFEEQTKSGKWKLRTYEASQVFSIHGAKGETLIYREDPMLGNWMSVDDTRLNVLGAYNAQQKYHPWWASGSAFGVSLGMSLLDTWLWKGRVAGDTTGLQPGIFGDPKGPSLFTLLVPVAFSVSISLPNYAIRAKRTINKELLGEQPFLRGYDRVARGRRFIHSISGGFAGLAAGMGLYYLFRKN